MSDKFIEEGLFIYRLENGKVEIKNTLSNDQKKIIIDRWKANRKYAQSKNLNDLRQVGLVN